MRWPVVYNLLIFFVKTWDEQHSVKNKSLHMRSMNSLRKFGNHGLQNLVKSRWWMIGPLTQRSNSLWPIYFCKLMSCLRKNENLIAWKISKKLRIRFSLKHVLSTSSSHIYLGTIQVLRHQRGGCVGSENGNFWWFTVL